MFEDTVVFMEDSLQDAELLFWQFTILKPVQELSQADFLWLSNELGLVVSWAILLSLVYLVNLETGLVVPVYILGFWAANQVSPLLPQQKTIILIIQSLLHDSEDLDHLEQLTDVEVSCQFFDSSIQVEVWFWTFALL